MSKLAAPTIVKSFTKNLKRIGRSFRRSHPQVDGFNEAVDLAKNPDVASAVANGQLRSGRHHYDHFGRLEGRIGAFAPPNTASVDYGVEALKFSDSGALLLFGWLDDFSNPCESIALRQVYKQKKVVEKSFWRFDRADVQQALTKTYGYRYGFGLFNSSFQADLSGREYLLEFRSPKGVLARTVRRPEVLTDLEMRDSALEFLGFRPSPKNPHLRAVRDLEHGFGEELIKLNRRVIAGARNVSVSRLNPAQRHVTKSFITCIYGLPQLLSLQVALFSKCARFEETEFVCLCNSPENGEELLQQAKQAARLYNVSITVIHTDRNLGFAAGNNLAAQYAASNRLLFINPDVLPMDHNWIITHDAFAATPGGKFFGTCLYYNDGSVMHAGMYFERERFVDTDAEVRDLLRIEHYAKGFPNWAAETRQTRIVPGVTGAFMSIERAHFERLGGFDEDYVLGNYEDADLCLRSAAQGQPVWYCSEVRLWHMEGKGSIRRGALAGASALNKWRFARKWLSVVSAGCTDGEQHAT